MPIIYLALGSNLGDRHGFIQKAIEELKGAGLKVLKVSSLIETDPVGGVPQGRYINAVLKASTFHTPEDLHEITRTIEIKLGRIRKTVNGPRVIDIDILLYDEIKLITPRLSIPHPRMLERAFVMLPFKEIEPVLCASLKI